MDSSFWFYIIHLGWSIVYIEGSQVIIPKNIIFRSLNIHYVLALCDISSRCSPLAKVPV